MKKLFYKPFITVILFVFSSILFNTSGSFSQTTDLTPIKRTTGNSNLSKQPAVPYGPNNSSAISINVPGDYSTIQAAINAANNGDIISVDPGVYREDIILNKYLQVRGANYGVNPSGPRGPESIIQPGSSDPIPVNGVVNFYIGVSGSGSVIDGFTFNGDNPTLQSNVIVNGADMDAMDAIGAFDNLSNTTISNNIIKNIYYTGIELYNISSASTYDNIISNNKFENIFSDDYGIAVLIYNNCYAGISGNVMNNVRIGVQTGNFEKADIGTNHFISGNTIESYRLAIFHNLAYSNATAFDVSNNMITTQAGAPNNEGIEIASIGGGVGASVNNNNITGTRIGVELWNCTTSNTITVTGGNITSCNIGVFANNYDGYDSDAGSSIYAMTGVTTAGCDTSIWIRDNNLNSNNATVALNINNATNTISGTGIGLLIEGGGASVNFNGAVPADFNTSLSKYIRLITNGSNVPSNINAQNVRFGGVDGTTLTNAQLFAVEDKIDHKIDWNSLGFVSVKANNNYVTVNSFYPPNTSSALIQWGIGAASAGDTTNIDAGTYNEQVLVNKSLTVKGSGSPEPVINFTGTFTGKPALFDVSVRDVNIENIRFKVDQTKLRSAIIASGADLDNIKIKDNIIEAYGSSAANPNGSYGDRNAVSINYTGSTNYRIASGGVDNITFEGNIVSGVSNDGFGIKRYFRAGVCTDESGGSFTGNTLQSINQDIQLRFCSNGNVNITNNNLNGGGVEFADMNAAAGSLTVSGNTFDGTFANVEAAGTAVLRLKNNTNFKNTSVSGNTFINHQWGASLENYNSVTFDNNTFTPLLNSTVFHHIAVNTKSISTNSNSIVQVSVNALFTNNTFNYSGTNGGTGLSFYNHDNDAAVIGAFTVGSPGNENNFNSGMGNFVYLDNQTGASSGSAFPAYTALIGSAPAAVTTMSCWATDVNIENNKFDVGSGLQLPAAMNFSQRSALELALFHKPDNSCLGSLMFFFPVHNLTQNNFYDNIQNAVNSANANDVIECEEFIYNERVTITKPLTLQGTSEVNCKIDGAGFASQGRGIFINNGITNVTIKKLTVQNFAGSNGNTDAGIYAIGGNNNLVVEHVTLKNNVGGSGFYANGPINNVTIDSVTSSGHTSNARGIVIWNGLKENITITNCTVFNNNCCGLELQDGSASGVTITNNNVHDNFDNGIGLVGLQGPGENIVSNNTLVNNGRFGIEIKNPDGSGLTTGAGRIVVENNNVSRNIAIADNRDIAGIAAFRRALTGSNVDIPKGVVIQNNIVSGYTQPSTSEGFGIVVEGYDHTVSGNNVSGCDVGIQRQSGHLPYPGDGNQSDVADTYFGRGNSPATCGVTLSGNILSNAINTRDVGAGTASGIIQNINTSEIFCTIQAAIDDPQTLNTHVIDIDSGAYTESVVINKQVKILGNGGSPNASPSVEGIAGQTFSVTVPNVTIDNITVKFNQTTVNSGIRAAASGSFNNLTIRKSTILGTATTGTGIFGSFGIQVGSFGGVLYDKLNLDSNVIKNSGTSPLGRGVRTFNCYGDWKNSDIEGFYSFQSGDNQGGILNITNNNLKGESELNNFGTGAHSFVNNVCEPSNAFGPGTDFAMLELKNISLTGAGITVSGNTFQNYINFGIFSGRSNSVTIDNNTFTPAPAAVNFRSIRIDTKQRTTAPQIAFVSGANILNNSFFGNTAIGQTGISVELANSDNVSSIGTVTLGTAGNENLFQNNVNRNISLNNETTSTSGDPVWAGTYVSTKAKVTNNFSGTDNKYDVGSGLEFPAGMSLTNEFLLEDKIQHSIDDSGLGFVTEKANNVYVTVNSFAAPATTTPSVQRGIYAASPGFVVNVGNGTYNEDIDINKSLIVDGESTAAILRGLNSGSANSVFISSSNATLKDVSVTRNYGVTLADWNTAVKNQGINVAQGTTGIVMQDLFLSGNRNAIFVNNAQNVTITGCTIEDNRTGLHFGNNISGAEIHNNFIRNNFTHGVLFNYDLAVTITSTNVHITDNDISGNWYSQVNFQRNSGPIPSGDHTGLLFSCNWYGTPNPSIVPANAAEPGYTSQVPSQFGGTDPGLNRQLYGIEIARCPYVPYLTSGIDDDNLAAGFQPVPGACNGTVTKYYVNDNSTSNDVFTSAVGSNSNPGSPSLPFLTISYAVSIVNPGDTIYVDAGLYAEQVSINKSLTLIGADSAGISAAIIKSPAVLSLTTNTNGAGFRSVVYASGTGNIIDISHIGIDGDGRGGDKFSGIYYFEASGTFSNSRITGVRGNPFDGLQSGNAFFANHKYDTSISQTVNVADNLIEDYQKAGILINELNTHGIVTNNIVIGQNIPHVNGQNGIQFGYGAYGTISGNNISNNLYNGPSPDAASGILLAGAGVDASNVPTGNTTTVGGPGVLANILNGNEAALLTDGGGFGYDSNAGIVYNNNSFANNYIHVSHSSPNTIPSPLNVYDKRIDNTSQTNIVYGQIQRSVNDAGANDILNVSAHTFTEQVEIKKALTLEGQGSGMTTIVSPDVLALSFTTSDINKPVIYVHDTLDVMIKGITVDGAGKGNGNYRFQGIAYHNAGGTIRDCEIKDIQNTPFDGAQIGVGIYALADNGNARTLNIIKNSIHDFQKNATALSGADLTTLIDSNTITGSGPVNFIAQNGIQLGFGAAGSISNNTISSLSYTPGPDVACGILLYQPSSDVTTSYNTLSASQAGIYYFDIGGTISGNTINATAANTGTTAYYGIIADPGGEPRIIIKPFDQPVGSINAKVKISDRSSSLLTSIYRNVLTSDGTNGIGLEMDAIGTETLNATAIENKINGWDDGVFFYKDAGATLNGIVNDNDLSGNTLSLNNLTGVLQNATCNWFGTVTQAVILSKVSGPLNINPFLTDGTDNDGGTIGFQKTPSSCNGILLSTLNIKVLPEGFYNTSTQKLNMRDTVKAYLHSSVSPYNVLDSSVSAIDSVSFTGSFTFSQSSGTYYIVLIHRNSIETWSKTGGEIFTSGSVMSYDFSDAVSKAFSNNLKLVDSAPVTYGIYSGDVDQDGFILLQDFQAIYNDGVAFASGYLNTDVTGDNITDLSDLVIAYSNSVNFVMKFQP